MNEKKGAKENVRRRRIFLCACGLLLCGTVFAVGIMHGRGAEETPQIPEPPLATEPVAEEPPAPAARTDYSDVALLGNSQIDSFRIYDTLPGADYLYRVGLTVKTVFEKPMVNDTVPVIDKLNEKQYGYIFLLFGENELGWSYPEIFVQEYGKVIDAARERQPEAKLYIQSILPVSAKVSQKNEDNTNNARIEEYNGMLRTLAEEKSVEYLDVAAIMKDETGCLPDEASVDGVHPGKAYCQKWADLIAAQIEEDK